MSMAASMEGDSSISESERRLFLDLGIGINMFSRSFGVQLTGGQEVVLERAVES